MLEDSGERSSIRVNKGFGAFVAFYEKYNQIKLNLQNYILEYSTLSFEIVEH